MKGKDKKLKKQEEEEKEETEEEEEEGEGEEKFKSDNLTEDDLEKSLAQLEELASAGDTDARKDTLLEKAKTETLEKSEQDELFQLLGGEPRDEASLGENVVEGFGENETVAKALDVSEYLQENHTELTKSLEKLADHIEQGENRQHQFNLVLARAVAETGRLAKSMAERLGVIENQPAQAPKAKRGLAQQPSQPLEKSFAGQAGGEQLSKSDVLDGLEVMIRKSVKEGHGGATEDGIDLAVAASKFEQFGTITPSLLNRVRTHMPQGGTIIQ